MMDTTLDVVLLALLRRMVPFLAQYKWREIYKQRTEGGDEYKHSTIDKQGH